MHGGLEKCNKLILKNESNEDNINQTTFETKNDNLLNNEQIKTNNLLNKTKILNTENQNTNYLIEYFEGIVLSYIKLYEYRGENVDKLKKIILNNNSTNTKIKTSKNVEPSNIVGGDDYNFIINYEGIINIYIDKNTNNNTYKINIITNEVNSNNFFLRIDLQNNIIEMNVKKINDRNIFIYNDNIYKNNNNYEIEITTLLEKLIIKLINPDIYGYAGRISFSGYYYNGNRIQLNPSDSIILMKSTIPLLIIILTLRTNINKNIYTKYIYAYLLSGICKNNLLQENIYKNPEDKFMQKFGGNNINILTYESVNPINLTTYFNNRNNGNNTNLFTNFNMNNMNSEYLCFEGDCIFNSLMCVRKPEIRELLVDRMTIILNKDADPFKNNTYYYNKIISILNELNNNVTAEYCLKIANYINEYNTFVNGITSNNYQPLIRNINILNLILFSEKIEEMRRQLQLVNNYNNLSEYIDKYKDIKEYINNFDNTDNVYINVCNDIDKNIKLIDGYIILNEIKDVYCSPYEITET